MAATADCCPSSYPNFAVVCSFLERYGALLELPKFTFPQLERSLQETSLVPKPLMELHLKLMRKTGRTITAERWEKSLVKMCQDLNRTLAWEMEQKGYQQMTVEYKLGILKYLCECQFDDNLKFKNVINEEDPDEMRLSPVGRDKEGLMYWYQTDQDHNVRLYIEEKNDQDNNSWKCIVRNRNELAETLELLKGQISTTLLNKPNDQDGFSSSSPKAELECKTLDGEEEKKLLVTKEENSTEKTDDTAEEKVVKIKQEVDEEWDNKSAECKKETEIKVDGMGENKNENNLKPITSADVTAPKDAECTNELKDVKEESKPHQENIKSTKNSSTVIKELKDFITKDFSSNAIFHELEKQEVGIVAKNAQDSSEKTTEEAEKILKNDQQAKIPLKKRELKLTEDFDASLRSSLTKSSAAIKDPLNDGKLEEGLKRTSSVLFLSSDKTVKHLVNGEVMFNTEDNCHNTEGRVEEDLQTGNSKLIFLKEEHGITAHMDRKGNSEPPSMDSKLKGDTEKRVACRDTKVVQDHLNSSQELSSKDEQMCVEKDIVRKVVGAEEALDLSSNNEMLPKMDGRHEVLPKMDGKPVDAPKLDGKPKEAPKVIVKPEKACREGGKPEEAPREDGKPEEAAREDGKPEEAPLEDGKSEEAPLEDGKSEEAPREDGKPKEVPREDSKPKEDPMVDSTPEDAPKVDNKPEEAPKVDDKPEELTCPSETENQAPLASTDHSEEHKGDDTSTRISVSKRTKKSKARSKKRFFSNRKDFRRRIRASKARALIAENLVDVKDTSAERPKDLPPRDDLHLQNKCKLEAEKENSETSELSLPVKCISGSMLISKKRKGNLKCGAGITEVKTKGSEKTTSDYSSKVKDNRSKEKWTSEEQKDGIKLTLRISNKRNTDEQQIPQVTRVKKEESEQVCIDNNSGQALRRSPRISKPTAKVAEILDRKNEKKRNEEEEKLAAQRLKEEAPKLEKDPHIHPNKPKSQRKVQRSQRRKKKVSSEEESEESDSEKDMDDDLDGTSVVVPAPAEDEEPCKKCSLSNHPELILLCDSCDSGYHTACLCPPLMIIPDGEWFCPPCEHKLLCEKLEEKLQDLDSHLKKKERAERRRERLVFVGISLDNIIPSVEPEVETPPEEKKKNSKKSPMTERRSTRARKLISYRFDDFDEAIDEAIEEDVRDAEGGGGGKGKDMSNITGHRGKDMSTILKQEGEEKQENRRPQRAAACYKKRRRLNDLDSDSNFDDESEDEFKISESSQDDFVVSEEGEDTEDHVISDDSDYDVRRPKWRFVKPMKRTRRLHRRRIKRRRRRRRYSDDDGEESDSDDDDKSSQSLASSDYSSDALETRRRSKRNKAKQVNYREDSDTEEGSVNSNIGRQPFRRVHKHQLSSSESSDENLRTGHLEKKPRLRCLHSDEESIEEERTAKKRFNRIETDEEEEEKAKSDNFASDNSSSFLHRLQETNKKHPFRIESDDDDDFDNVKDESPLDYSLVDLTSANGHSPGKAIENLIGKSGNKTLAPKDSISHPILEPNGLGQEAVGLEEDEDELLSVTDLVDYVCNSEQL